MGQHPQFIPSIPPQLVQDPPTSPLTCPAQLQLPIPQTLVSDVAMLSDIELLYTLMSIRSDI